MSFADHVNDHGVQVAAKAATAVGSASTVGFGLTSTEWQAIGIVSGILIGLAGLYLQWRGTKKGTRR